VCRRAPCPAPPPPAAPARRPPAPSRQTLPSFAEIRPSSARGWTRSGASAQCTAALRTRASRAAPPPARCRLALRPRRVQAWARAPLLLPWTARQTARQARGAPRGERATGGASSRGCSGQRGMQGRCTRAASSRRERARSAAARTSRTARSTGGRRRAASRAPRRRTAPPQRRRRTSAAAPGRKARETVRFWLSEVRTKLHHYRWDPGRVWIRTRLTTAQRSRSSGGSGDPFPPPAVLPTAPPTVSSPRSPLCATRYCFACSSASPYKVNLSLNHFSLSLFLARSLARSLSASAAAA